MTSFLRLNGIAVPVAVASSPAVGQEDIGKMRRAVDGTAVIPRRGVKKNWKFGTTIKTAAESLAWRDLITGRGHVLSFDAQNYYTSKGMAPVSVAAGWGFTTSGPKYGAACAAWTTGNATWAFFASGAPWTISYWLSVNAVAAWHNVVVNSSGYYWVDGVLNSPPPIGWSTGLDGFGGVAAGVATFGSTAASKIDDIVALPFLAPDDWAAQIYGFGSAFGLLPVLTADGLFIELNVATSVIGGEPTGRPIMAKTGGALVKNLHDFSFQLFER